MWFRSRRSAAAAAERHSEQPVSMHMLDCRHAFQAPHKLMYIAQWSFKLHGHTAIQVLVCDDGLWRVRGRERTCTKAKSDGNEVA